MKWYLIYVSSTIFIAICVYAFLFAFKSRLDDKIREWKEVMCDIWVWDSFRWTVVAEDDERIYIKWQRQCLMYCRNAPYWDEAMLDEMWVNEEYQKRYDDDDVKFKFECYRIGNDNDKMKAIINRYWRDEEK